MSRRQLRWYIRAANLVVYLGVLVAAPGLDAVLEARTAGQEAHIETRSDMICSPSHDAYCQLCRIIDVTAAPTDRARIDTAEPCHHNEADLDEHRPARSAAPLSKIPRAPPSA